MGKWLSDGWLGNVFSPTLQLQVGGGAGLLSVGGVVYASGGLATNVSTTETTLFTYTLPANAFNKNGQSLRVQAWGTLGGVASGTTARVNLYFGANVTQTTSITTAALNDWTFDMRVIRSGPSQQEFFLRPQTGGTNGSLRGTSPTETDTAAIVIRISGASVGGGTNGNVIGRGMIVEFSPI